MSTQLNKETSVNGEVYKTFKFYDRKGRRLSIYGVDIKSENKLQVFVIHCSKEDAFSKKKGDELFVDLINGQTTSKPDVYDVPYSEKPKQAFLHFCRNMYNIIVPYQLVIKHKLVNAADFIDNNIELWMTEE